MHAGPSKTENQVPGELQSALAGRYVLEGLLGAGGMAHVYRALDVRHQRRVAVKVLRADLSHVLGSDRFMQEIRTTATLQHPHILPLLDSGDAAGCLFYVMPLVVGETLRTHLDRVGNVPIAQAVALVRQLAAALDYAHRHRVIHRDIKPENILMTDGLPLLADFGIALGLQQAEDSRLTQTGFSLGTPQYMSPEQVLGAREIDGRSDQYSLACVLFEAISGQPPFRGTTGHATMMEHRRRMHSMACLTTRCGGSIMPWSGGSKTTPCWLRTIAASTHSGDEKISMNCSSVFDPGRMPLLEVTDQAREACRRDPTPVPSHPD